MNQPEKQQDQYQIHRDTIMQSCTIEVGLLNSIDSINHVIDQYGEGMTLNTQRSILGGAVALLEFQITRLIKMRRFHLDAIPDPPDDDEEPCPTCGVI